MGTCCAQIGTSVPQHPSQRTSRSQPTVIYRARLQLNKKLQHRVLFPPHALKESSLRQFPIRLRLHPSYWVKNLTISTKFEFAESARDRIIRITNVHFDADKQFIKDFFEGFTIVDQIRTHNTRTGTRSVVYILFASTVERICATEYSGQMVLGREIKIQPAHSGNFTINETETAFVHPVSKKKTGRKNSTKLDVTAAIETPESHETTVTGFTDTDFPAFGAAKDENNTMKTPALPILTTDDTFTPTVGTELDDTAVHNSLNMSSPQKDNGQAPEEKDNNPKSHYNKAPFMFPTAAAQHKTQLEAAATSSLQNATLNFYHKAAQIKNENPAPTPSSRPSHIPSNINMSIPPAPDNKNWNLSGHEANDQSKNIVTPGDWYNFQANEKKKAEEDQKARNAERIKKWDEDSAAKDGGEGVKK